jgi:hypothetical protein
MVLVRSMDGLKVVRSVPNQQILWEYINTINSFRIRMSAVMSYQIGEYSLAMLVRPPQPIPEKPYFECPSAHSHTLYRAPISTLGNTRPSIYERIGRVLKRFGYARILQSGPLAISTFASGDYDTGYLEGGD